MVKRNSQKKTEKSKKVPAQLKGKWEKCLKCKFNGFDAKRDLQIGDFQKLSCSANIEDFQCDRIPELYPHKLFDKIETNMKDDKVLCSSESFDLEVYSLEFYDSIHDNIIRVLIASDSKERIEEHFKEVVKKKIYSHLQLYSLKSVNDAFKNYSILVVPNEVNKVVFPELNIEMDHYGKNVIVEEMVYDLKRFPGISTEKCKNSHIKVDEHLSKFVEKGKQNGKSSTRKGKPGKSCRASSKSR